MLPTHTLPIPITYDFSKVSVSFPFYEIIIEELEEHRSNLRARKLNKKKKEIKLMKEIILQQEKDYLDFTKSLKNFSIPEDVLDIIKSYLGNVSMDSIGMYSKKQIIEQASRNYPQIEPISIWDKFTSCLKSKNSQTTEKYITEKYFNSSYSIEFISVADEELEHLQLSGLDTESTNHFGSVD